MQKLKSFLILGALALSTLLTACGTVETGNVGVRTQFGQIDQSEVHPGFYTSLLSSVDEFTAKETSVVIIDLTPKAEDKLKLKDLDVTVFYETNGDKIADFNSTRAGMSVRMKDESFFRPGYILIDKLARGAASDAVSKFDSQMLHTNREALEKEIRTALQDELEKSDAGVFKITRVTVSSLLTDESVEDSIRKNIQAQNDIATANKRVAVREQEAAAMTKTANALTPMLLQHDYIKAIDRCAANPGCTLIVDGSSSGKMLNIGK